MTQSQNFRYLTTISKAINPLYLSTMIYDHIGCYVLINNCVVTIHVQEREREVYKLCQECCQDMNTLMVFRFGEDFESWEAYDT